jgi:hypothetical protein
MPLTWLRVHIKNINPFDDNDLINFDNDFTLEGQFVDTMFYIQFTPNVSEINSWWITKNNQTTTNYSIKSCAPLDTCILNIFY